MVEHQIKELPSFLEIMSYTFFCCGASIGVFFEYSDYIKFIKMEGHYKQVPNPIFESVKFMFLAFIFAGINQWLQVNYYDAYFDSESYRGLGMVQKYWAIWMYNYSFRTFYYIAFML